MKIVKWNPFHEIDEMFEDDFVPVGKGVFAPAIDVYQANNDLVVEMPLPNVDPKDVKITVDEDNVLHVKGSTRKEEEQDKKNYYRKEISVGSFSRSYSLPVDVKSGEAKAEFKDGTFKVIIPKAEATKPKEIDVEIK